MTILCNRRRILTLGINLIIALGLGAVSVPQAKAGVFAIPHFVQAGSFSVGVEPELTLTDGAGVAANFKYTQGLNDLMNVTGIIGSGGGPRKFRIGAAGTFDFFPDLEGQPGMGVAVQGLYVDKRNYGQFEMTGIPYIHKSLTTAGNELEPFLAIPFGLEFHSATYTSISQVVLGSMFKPSEKIRFIMELGIAINRSDTYVSGGVTYYH